MDADQIERYEIIINMFEELPVVLRSFVKNCHAKATEAQYDLDVLLDTAQTVEDSQGTLDEIYRIRNK